MIQAERHERILAEVARRGAISIVELCDMLEASPATIRRDLAELERKQAVRRTHGGARLPDLDDELTYAAKITSLLAEKRRIGAAAAAQVAEGQMLGCGGGTTMMQMIRAVKHKRLSVVTTAVNIAVELSTAEQIDVLVAGGQLRGRSCETVGHVAERTLRDVNVDLAIIGVDGLCPTRGLTTFNQAEAYVNRIMIERARETWILADHSKFGVVRPAIIAPISAVHRVFTDMESPQAVVAALRRAKIRVTMV
jgi:DeoR/GlpR family transcriptional regulator of sugar metabolism